MMHDVIIIGGGIAGLALSIDLAEKGHSIAVIEKGNYPRHKVCGEYVSMESRRYLQKLCPELENINTPFIKIFCLSSTGKAKFNIQLQQGGFGISRFLLEELLFKRAQKIGVIFYLNTKARNIIFNKNENYYSVEAGGYTLTAKLICNSTGRKSNFPEADKIKNNANYVGVKYHVKLERDSSLIEIHNFPGGYCGISNIEEGKSCLCYIINSEQIKSSGNSIVNTEKNILSKNLNLRKIFNDAEFLFESPVTVSGIDFKVKKTVQDKIFYLGDSAGSIAPVTGNGMSMALRSAHALAISLDYYLKAGISKKQLEEQYSIFWKKEFAGRVKLSRYFQKLSEYPVLTKTAISIFNVFPSLADLTIKQTCGKPF